MDICESWLPVNTQMYFWVAVCDRGSALACMLVCLAVRPWFPLLTEGFIAELLYPNIFFGL